MITCGWCWTFCILRWPFRYQSLFPPCKSKLAGKKKAAEERGRGGKIDEVCLYPCVCACSLQAYVRGGPCGVARSGKQVRQQGDVPHTPPSIKQGAIVTLFGHSALIILCLQLHFGVLSNSFKSICWSSVLTQYIRKEMFPSGVCQHFLFYYLCIKCFKVTL